LPGVGRRPRGGHARTGPRPETAALPPLVIGELAPELDHWLAGGETDINLSLKAAAAPLALP